MVSTLILEAEKEAFLRTSAIPLHFGLAAPNLLWERDLADSTTSRDTLPAASLLARLIGEVEQVFSPPGKEVVHLAVAALLRGVILIEDVAAVGTGDPGPHALATASGLSFRRIQSTRPTAADILGISLYISIHSPRTLEFETRPGPIFTNLVLGDEIDRAPPRTTERAPSRHGQRGNVTLDDTTFELPRPFAVMAIQNPLEHHEACPLNETPATFGRAFGGEAWTTPRDENIKDGLAEVRSFHPRGRALGASAIRSIAGPGRRY